MFFRNVGNRITSESSS